MEDDDELLPGRTEDEERALAPTRKAVAKAIRERDKSLDGPKPEPATMRGLRSRLRRAIEAHPEHAAKVAAAEDAHRAKLQELADARRAMLPADAVSITVGADPHYHDDRRYPVGYVTVEGMRGSLGGCSNMGDQQDRWRWFEDELKRRAAA